MPSYTKKQKKVAVELYIKYDKRAGQTMRELGYPNDRHTLRGWYREYEKDKDFHDRRKESRLGSGYTKEQMEASVRYYLEHGRNLRATIRALGFPHTYATLKVWIKALAPGQFRVIEKSDNQIRYDRGKVMAAIGDYLRADDKPVRKIAEEHGVSRGSIYGWKTKLGIGGYHGSMKRQEEPIPQGIEELRAENERLREETKRLREVEERLRKDVYWLQMQKDILEKAGELIKKEEGVSLAALTNREKATLVDALRTQYKVADLIKAIGVARSTYFAQERAIKAGDKYAELRVRIRQAFEACGRCYGYRRIHEALKRAGQTVSEKVVRRIMRQESLRVPSAKRPKKFSSYVGEVSPAVPNLLRRDFHADRPNQKWLSDISEFSLPAGKVYLSPVIDCFDGMPVAWTIGTSPSAELANSMLDQAIGTLKGGERPVVHTDRGGHYRWPGWIERMQAAGLTRSMSRKGCSPDNSACEGFFGRIKNEMFYGRNWKGWSLTAFSRHLDQYLHWFQEERIKLSLGGMSPMDYRRKLGFIPS